MESPHSRIELGGWLFAVSSINVTTNVTTRTVKALDPRFRSLLHHLGKLPRNRICLKFGQGEVGHYFLLDIFQQLSDLPLDASSNLFPNSYFFLSSEKRLVGKV